MLGEKDGLHRRAAGEGRNNNSDSSKNANSHLGAGVSRDPYGVNQFLQYKPNADAFGQFRNGGAHLPDTRMSAAQAPRYQHQQPRPGPDSPRPHVRYQPVGELQQLRQACGGEGPFVFGVHTPSQFQIGPRYQNDDTYDYPDAADEKPVIDNESESLYCDKKIQIKSKGENGEMKRGVFRINDSRTRKRDKQITIDPKKRKNKRYERKGKIKCVLVGDGAVGKTSLITAYAQDKFHCDYRPTTFDNYNVVVEVDGRPISVELCDTAGQDSLKGLRELCYPGTDVIILCFSVVKPETFRAVTGHWAPAVAGLCAPLVLVGTQGDLRDCGYTARGLEVQGESPVTEAEAKALAFKLNASYIETSSKTRNRLKDAFDLAILAALPVAKKKNSFWKRLFCIT